MITSFLEEFNRVLSDAIFEALLADQGVETHAQRRSRRAFEPAPPLFLPAPQLLEGILQVCFVCVCMLSVSYAIARLVVCDGTWIFCSDIL